MRPIGAQRFPRGGRPPALRWESFTMALDGRLAKIRRQQDGTIDAALGQ